MLQDLIPANVRKWIYTILSTALALEVVFDVIPDVWEGKALQALAVLGFVLANGNTPSQNA